MRYALPPALLALMTASPSLATIGLLCKPAQGGGPAVGLVFAPGPSGGVGAVNLKEGAVWRSSWTRGDGLLLTRSSLDRQRVRVEFLDTRRPQRVGRLSAYFSGHTASGTLVFGGRTRAVRCVQD